MLGVTLLTAGLVIAFIMGSKKPEVTREEEVEDLDDAPTAAAWKMMQFLRQEAENCINGRKEWIQLFESNDSMTLTSDMLQKENPDRYKRYRVFIQTVQELADTFQQMSYRLTNEEHEGDWVSMNQQLLKVPTETLQMMARFDRAVSVTTVNNQQNKQLVMNVQQYPNVNKNTQHNLEGAQNMEIVDNGVRDLSSLDVEMGGDPHSTSKAVAQIGMTKANPLPSEPGVYLNQASQPYNQVPSNMTAVALNDHANPAIEANYQPNSTKDSGVSKGYTDAKTMLKRGPALIKAPVSSGTKQGYNTAVVTKQADTLPSNPFEKERELPQAPREDDAYAKAIRVLNEAKDQLIQSQGPAADSRLSESREIPAKMPPMVTVQDEQHDAGTLALPAPTIPKVPAGALVPVPKATGVKRSGDEDPFVALKQPKAKQQKPSPSPAYSPSRISEEESDSGDLTGGFENVVDQGPEIGDKRTYEGMAGEEMSLRRTKPRAGGSE